MTSVTVPIPLRTIIDTLLHAGAPGLIERTAPRVVIAVPAHAVATLTIQYASDQARDRSAMVFGGPVRVYCNTHNNLLIARMTGMGQTTTQAQAFTVTEDFEFDVTDLQGLQLRQLEFEFTNDSDLAVTFTIDLALYLVAMPTYEAIVRPTLEAGLRHLEAYADSVRQGVLPDGAGV